jgi:hypothetical protein
VLRRRVFFGRSLRIKWGKKENKKMAKVSPFHSKLSWTRVYHDNNVCTEGNNIESYNRVSGTGGRPKCEHCKRLG